MWFVKYGDQYLHDPRVSVFVTDASLSPEVNASGEFTFTITKKHALYETLREHDIDNEVTVYNDGDLIFCGTVVEIDKDFQLTADVTCQGEMSYLNKSLIPPFSTLSTETGEAAPDNLADFFEWLIEKHNSQVDVKRQFVVGRNDGNSISDDTIYLSSDSYSSTGSVIKDNILENYTSYITIEHKDDKRVINLLKDFDPVNAQVIDFGANLLDFTDGVVSDEVYTVMIPLGAAMKDTEYDYFDGYSLTEDTTPDSSKQYYTHDTYTQATLKNVGTEDAPVYQFEDGVRYFEKVAKYTYTYAPWNTCNPNVTYYYNNKLTEQTNLYYFEYGVQYYEKRANGTYFKTTAKTPNWDKTYYRYNYSSVSDLKHFSRWEDGDRSGYDYYTRKASEFFIATKDSSPVHGKTYYTSSSSVSYTACDVPLSKFDGTKSYFEYDGHADESNQKLTLSAGPFETYLEDGYIKTGDKIVATDAVKKYGLMTTTYENTDITTREYLEKYGLAALKATVSPVRSLEVKAIDLAMIKPDYESIKIGQYIRARSKPHDLDSYFLCSKIDYDLNNPDNTTFTLGTTFDTLTGQQDKRIKSLNATINTVYEAAAKISDDAKANAVIAGQAQEKIDDANAKADDAQIKATEANTKADEASTKADEASTKADEAQAKAESATSDAKNAADAAADAAKKADDAAANVTLIQNRITTIEDNTAEAIANAAAAKEAADSAKADAEAANTAASNAQSAAESAQSKADEAYTAAGNVQSQVSNINTEITDIKQDATDLRKDLEGQIETVTNTMTADYAKKSELSETTESLKSEISKSAAGITSTVEATYAKKTELETTTQVANDAKTAADAAKKASDTNATDLSNAITKFNNDVDSLQGQIDGSIQTWFYEVPPTAENVPAKDWTTTQLKNNHLGDLYYDTVTGYCYRYQVQNNEYSWQRITDVDVTKALADAAKAQDTANHKRQVFVAQPTTPYDVGDLWVQGSTGDIMRCNVAKTDQQTYAESDWVKASKYTDDSAVTSLSNFVETTYSTKSEVEQLSDQVSSTVSAVETVKIDVAAAQTTADNAASAANAAQSAADDAKTNASNAQSAADAAKTAADAAQSKADEAAANLENAEKNLEDLQSQADATDEQLAAAQTAVANAKKAAEDAQSAADTAKADAATAKSTADTAKADAATAQTTANAAKSTAEKAQADVDSLENRVATAETKINQNAEAIELRATKTEVTEAVESAKSYTDAQLEITSESITSTVSETYQVKGDYATNAKVDSIEIGGRNLLIGTSVPVTHAGTGSQNQTTFLYDFSAYYVAMSSIAEKEMILSFEWETTATSGTFLVRLNADPWTQLSETIAVSSSNQSGSAVYTTRANSEFDTGSYDGVQIRSDDLTGTVTIKNVMLTMGNKSISWQPAPEDIEGSITDAESRFNASVETINSTLDDATNAIDDATDTLNESLQIIESNQSKITELIQKTDGFTMNFQTVTETVTQLNEQFYTDKNERLSYIRFIDGKIYLGKQAELGEDDFKMVISNERVSFIQNDMEVAYLSNSRLYITEAQITGSLRIGNYLISQRLNGNIGIRWDG